MSEGTVSPYSGPSGALKAGSEWLSSEDLPTDRDIAVTIKTALLLSDIPLDKGRKYTGGGLEFEGKEKRMILNATNRKALVRLFGANTSGWIGQPINLYVDTDVRFGAETVSGIRIRNKAADDMAKRADQLAGGGVDDAAETPDARCEMPCGDTSADEPDVCALEAGHEGSCAA